MANTRVCVIFKCGEPLSPRSKLDTCSRCRATFGRWAKRRPAEVLMRRHKLDLYGERIDVVIDERGIKK